MGSNHAASASASDAPCPCGRTNAKGKALSLRECCGRYLDRFETLPAPDAESLMRSRYTAFVRADANYLKATWHVSQRPAELGFDPATRWLGLAVKDARRIDDEHAEVEFVARYRIGGRAVRLHERSRFVREDDGRWYYVDGEQY
ncbi:hypothetical protein H9K75_15985 [Diaphorobacter aerolatus]|uniref:UPF0225 protein H9K75_15985 n=2 Tax=Diaphorobacter aerolatus TaxID=1288495 RepID=A0A7H0GQK2_9BURK|nr:hypothetical protein H9K75_15985 [Diaphorobacter aerolatus]